MRIEVLGCSGGIDRGSRTTTFLLDEDTLIDAGTGLYDLPLHAQYKIQQVFITHAHFDHVAGLPFLADTVARYRMENGLGPIQVYARPEVLEALHRHLFNNHIWPDFTRLPAANAPALCLNAVTAGQTIALAGGQRSVEVMTAVHSVPTVGYAIIEDRRAWVFTGDTGRNPQLWQRLNALQAQGTKVRWLVIEVTFTSQDQAFADLTGHLTASSLAEELQQLDLGGIEIYLTHMKPSDASAILDEVEMLRQAASAKNCRVHLMPRNHVFKRTPLASLPLQAAA